MKRYGVALLLLLGATWPAMAGAIPQLHAFIAGSTQLSASFQQRVTGAKGKVEEANGTLQITRPGRFRWNYTKPYEQLIIGDGRQLWVYDKELAQVTRRQLDQALGKSPAALLAGSNTLERDYKLAEEGKEGGIEWLTATPKATENTFNKVRMGLKNDTLVTMELTDTFGNITTIHFSEIKKNPPLNMTLFAFTPPPGVDVITSD